MERDGDSKKELTEGLQKAAQGNSRNKTARLREIFDDVEAAKDAGLSLKTIVAVLADRGLVFDLATFVNVRHRIKKERGLTGQKTTTHAEPDPSNPKSLLLDNKIPKPEINKGGKPKNGNTNLNATAVDTTKNTFTQKQDTSKYNTD